MAVDTLKGNHPVVPVPVDNDPLVFPDFNNARTVRSEITVDTTGVSIGVPPTWATFAVISPPRAHAKQLSMGPAAAVTNRISPSIPTVIALEPGVDPALQLKVNSTTLVVDIIFA